MKKMRPQSGYTLMEVLIAMVVLMLAFVALISVQTNALQGYISARDNTDAAELGRRVVELLTIEALQWRGTSSYSGGSAPYSGEEPFSATSTPVADIVSNEWTWVKLYDKPVSPEMSSESDNGNFLGGKLCAFARGGKMDVNLPSGTTDFTPALQLQVAVVYPGPHATLTSCDDVTTANLDNGSDSYPGESLEAEGLRVQHFATIVQPRPQ